MMFVASLSALAVSCGSSGPRDNHAAVDGATSRPFAGCPNGRSGVAHYDAHRALNECARGKAVVRRLESLKEKYQREIDDAEASILAQKRDIEANQDEYRSQGMLDEKVAAWEALVTELERLHGEYQKALNEIEDREAGEIVRDIRSIAEHMGDVACYELVYDSSTEGATVEPEHEDLTGHIIQILDGGEQL